VGPPCPYLHFAFNYAFSCFPLAIISSRCSCPISAIHTRFDSQSMLRECGGYLEQPVQAQIICGFKLQSMLENSCFLGLIFLRIVPQVVLRRLSNHQPSQSSTFIALLFVHERNESACISDEQYKHTPHLRTHMPLLYEYMSISSIYSLLYMRGVTFAQANSSCSPHHGFDSLYVHMRNDINVHSL